VKYPKIFINASKRHEPVFVVSNCQTLPIAKGMEKAFGDIQVRQASYLMGMQKLETEIEKISGDFYLVSSMQESFLEIFLNKYSDRVRHIVRIPEIYFPAFHPDQTYVQDRQDLVLKSPIGDYHSKIILFSFLQKLTEEECIRLFNSKTFENVGYFQAWESSVKELVRRFGSSDLDIEIMEKFLSGNQVFMNSFNHPNAGIINALTDAILSKLHPEGAHDRIGQVPRHDYLYGPGLVYPVFPEIADLFGEDGQIIFWKENGHLLNLDNFVLESYRMYTNYRQNLRDITMYFTPEFLDGMRKTLNASI